LKEACIECTTSIQWEYFYSSETILIFLTPQPLSQNSRSYQYLCVYSITRNMLDIPHNFAHSRCHDMSYNAQAHSKVPPHVIFHTAPHHVTNSTKQSSSWHAYSRSASPLRNPKTYYNRSQWPRGLRHGSAAARLLEWWLRIPPGVWMSVGCECCMLSGTGLWDRPIPRIEESYRVCHWAW